VLVILSVAAKTVSGFADISHLHKYLAYGFAVQKMRNTG
jgi:hypothetical protein